MNSLTEAFLGFPLPVQIAILIVALGASAWIAWRISRDGILLRQLAATPTVPIRSAHQGLVQIEGTATLLPGTPVVAPLTLLPCVWYRYRVEETRGSGRNRKRRVIDQGTSDALFSVDDGTSTVVVDPDHARVFFSDHDRWSGNTRHAPFPHGATTHRKRHSADHLLNKLNVSAFFGNTYTFHEERIPPGSQILVFGRFETRRMDASQRFEDQVAALLSTWKSHPPPSLNALPRTAAGHFTMDAWSQVRDEARREVRKALLTEPESKPMHLVAAPSSSDRRGRFLIVVGDEAAAVRRLGWAVAVSALGFVMAGSLSLWLLVSLAAA